MLKLIDWQICARLADLETQKLKSTLILDNFYLTPEQVQLVCEKYGDVFILEIQRIGTELGYFDSILVDVKEVSPES